MQPEECIRSSGDFNLRFSDELNEGAATEKEGEFVLCRGEAQHNIVDHFIGKPLNCRSERRLTVQDLIRFSSRHVPPTLGGEAYVVGDLDSGNPRAWHLVDSGEETS